MKRLWGYICEPAPDGFDEPSLNGGVLKTCLFVLLFWLFLFALVAILMK